MLTVQSLAGWEGAVLASVRGARGTLEERDRQVERSGMYAEYPAILSGYLEILEPESPREHERAEALKRAVFIAWYAGVEPRCLTGIPELSVGATTDAFARLEAVLRRGEADDELLAMVGHYHERCPWPFDLFGGAAAVERATRDAEVDVDTLLSGGPARFAGRGQMGEYWASLASRADRVG